MTKSMTSYINALTEDDYDLFEDIFINKYKKFSCFYWLICDFNDYIDNLHYNQSDSDTLNIDITMSSKVKKLVEKINEQIDDGISVSYKGKIVNIEITKCEKVIAD